MTPMRMPARRRNFGPQLVAALREVHGALKGRKPLTTRTITVIKPGDFTAAAVKTLRAKLGVSQRLFAALLGASPELSEGWEQGLMTPRPIAARLMNEIARDPAGFLERYLRRRTVHAPLKRADPKSRKDRTNG